MLFDKMMYKNKAGDQKPVLSSLIPLNEKRKLFYSDLFVCLFTAAEDYARAQCIAGVFGLEVGDFFAVGGYSALFNSAARFGS